jgi:hypothetical protein
VQSFAQECLHSALRNEQYFRLQIIKELAKSFQIGLIDTYALYKNKVKSGSNLVDYMSQVNHPNEKGHQMITDEIMGYFK